MLVVTSSVKHSPDLIAWPVHRRKRYLWDREGVKGYECQTSAREDSIRKNMGKSEKWGVAMVWVAGSKEVLDGVRDATKNIDEYMVV
jgi:hypothetical protein